MDKFIPISKQTKKQQKDREAVDSLITRTSTAFSAFSNLYFHDILYTILGMEVIK